MNRYLQAELTGAKSIDNAVQVLNGALSAYGFSVLADIDASALVRRKPGVSIARTRIVEAFDAALAANISAADPGAMVVLTCAFVLVESPRAITVNVADPAETSLRPGTEDAVPTANRVSDRLESVLLTVAAAREPDSRRRPGAGGAMPASEDRLRTFTERLEKMTSRFRRTGSLSGDGAPEASPVRRIGDTETDHDVALLDSNIRHVISLLDSDEHRFYAARRSNQQPEVAS
ncbi:MAG: hypothetical protein Kow0026_12550 [Oricola sp.]